MKKDIKYLKNTVNKVDLIDTCRILQLTTAENTFKNTQNLYKIGQIIVHKTNISKYHWTEIIQNTFSGHSGIK